MYHCALFLNSTGLLKWAMFAILEKITRVANDTQSRMFHEYQLLDRLQMAIGQSCCSGDHIAILLVCQVEILHVYDYHFTSAALH